MTHANTPEKALGYPATERTRFSVRIEIHEGRDPVKPGVMWIEHLRTLDACQRLYIATRNNADLGGSQFGTGHVFDEAGQFIATISYNGRLWPTDVWTPGQEFIAESPERERIAS